MRESKLALSLAIVVLVFATGCSRKRARVVVPPAPSSRPAAQGQAEESAEEKSPGTVPSEIEISPDAKPLLVETGTASWYGPPYHNRRGSNGEIYDMHAMTAAHRTLPLGSIVRVVNVESGASAVVRITDRGPFIEGRILDLSKAAAEKIGMLQKGTAKIRVEVLKTPAPIDVGGRWAVQIGAFAQEQPARDLAGHLTRRYPSAKVLTFGSPVGDWWVRVRVQNDLRARAEEVIKETSTAEGAIFLVRLD